MTRKCSRCLAEFTARTAEQYRCPECEAWTRAQIAADNRRRNRFAKAKDLSGLSAV